MRIQRQWMGWAAALGLLLGSSVASAKAKVILIGVDGVSLNLLEPFAQEGITPNLKALMERGARGDLASIWPLRTPQVWTTVVTGKLPGQHGVWDHKTDTYFNPPEVRTKESKRVTTDDRRSKALWNLLAEAKRPSLTVGWVPSWPAEVVTPGVMVAPIELFGDSRQTTIKGSFWRDQKRLVTPASLWPRVKNAIVEIEDLSAQEVAAFADIPKDGDPLYALPRLERYVYAIRWSLARAKSVENITLNMLKDHDPELLSVYFQCTDSLLHRFWIFQEGEQEVRDRMRNHGIPDGQAGELARRFGGVVKACYRDVDARIGKILQAAVGEDTLVLLVSDHGFGPAPKPHRMKGEPFSGDHKDEGIILAAGPGIPAGSVLNGAAVTDIAPTVLWYLGMDVGEDMVGRPLVRAFQDRPEAQKQVRFRPSYEAKPQIEIPHREGYPVRKPH